MIQKVSFQKAPKGSVVVLMKEQPQVDKARMKVASDELYGQHDKSDSDISEDELRKVRQQQVTLHLPHISRIRLL